MAVLSEQQIKHGYFHDIGGFPPLDGNHRTNNRNFAVEVGDYLGQEKLCICCTQLPDKNATLIFSDIRWYSKKDQRRILSEWVDFLRANRKVFKALHFNSRVPQALFDAACCQENLEELRFKWGAYSDLSALANLRKLQYLHIGSGAGVKEITVLAELADLVVLYIQNFKQIEDYSLFAKLNKLEQLIISGPILGNTPIKDLEFLRKMNNLLSIWLPNTIVRKKYTPAEKEDLFAVLPRLHFMYT